MAKPRLIILIRHAQSEGNKNREIHQTIPDHRVKLTQDGWQQAYEAGRRLRAMLRADDTIHFFTSPYRRTRETTEGILATLTSDQAEPSPFKRNNIKVYEEPRLREQDFGNFQPCSAEMERMWQERADYGHFFYRIPNGESAADAYDRVSGFNESLWRQFGEDDFASVCVLVTHGLMSRVFLMKWYHFSVEYFEDLRNVNHCEFLIMRKQESGKYKLENKLRTWSELRRERSLEAGKDGKDGKESKEDRDDRQKMKDMEAAKENGTSKDRSKLDTALSSTSAAASSSSPVETRRRWGGCPNGCDHDKSFKIRQTLADLVKSDSITSSHTSSSGASATTITAANNNNSSSTTVDSNGNGNGKPVVNAAAATVPGSHVNPSFNGNGNSTTIVQRRPAAKRFQSQNADAETPEEAGPQIDITRAQEEMVSSPDGTPSFISVEDRLRAHEKSPNLPPPPSLAGPFLHVGRDFGGTYSGHNSVAASDADSSEDDKDGARRRRLARLKGSSAAGVSSDESDAVVVVPRHHHHHHHSHYHHHHRDQSGMGRGTKANRLGDAPHSSDGEHEADEEPEPEDDLARAEREDKSIEGSVY